ncbi:MAG TPA: Replication factor C small subunit, partial [Flavobacteriaceae bacterium]|nr:Replication factor C small subunit [Flavobacteriaceae bacterium]
EKYRPDTVENYVFRDQAQKEQVQGWIKGKTIPHLLFSGAPGIGKTTLPKILINELNIDQYDVLEINASRENSVDVIRERISNFVATMPFGDLKIVLLDGADYISPNGQA